MRTLFLTLALCWCVFHGDTVHGDDLFFSDAYRHGDLPALEESWARGFENDPDSWQTQTRLLLWNRALDLLPETRLTAVDWRRLGEKTTNGWTRRLFAWRERQALLTEGKIEEGFGVDLEHGSPRQWIGIGPFGQRSRSAFHQSFAPEVRFEGNATYEDQGRTLRWRPMSVSDHDTRIFPRDHWSKRGGTFYYRTRFGLAAPTDAVLQIASSGSFKIWLDGTPVRVVDRARNALPRVFRLGVKLAEGPHTVLIKGNGASVSLLVRSAAGEPVDIVQLDPWQDLDGKSSPHPDLSLEGLAVQELSEEWQRGSISSSRRTALAFLLATDGDDTGARAVLMDAESDGPTIDLALLATLISSDMRYLPQDWKKNWLNGLWKQALAEDEHLVPVLLAKAHQLISDDQDQDAVEVLAQILEIAPNSLDALLMQLNLFRSKNWEKEYIAALRQLEEAAPQHPAVLNASISYYTTYTQQPRATLPLREKVHNANPTPGTAMALAQNLFQIGRHDEAMALADKILSLGGNSTQAWQTRKQLMSSWGKTEETLRCLAELQKRNSDNGGLVGEEANLRWSEGQEKEALSAYRRALEIDPGQIAYINRVDYLEKRLSGGSYRRDRFWELYEYDGDQVIANAPAVDKYPKAAAVYLLDQAVTRFRPDGGVDDLVHMIIRLDSQESVNEFSNINIPGEILELRVIAPDGRELHPTSAGGYGRYTLPGLEVGSIVEQKSISQRDLGRPENATYGPFYFRDMRLANAFHLSQVVMLFPTDWELRLRERSMEDSGIEKTDEVAGEYREIVWTAREMDRFEPERGAPPIDQYLPNIEIFAKREWKDSVSAVASRAQRRDFVPPEIVEATAEILEGVEGRRAQVLALYDAVCERIKSGGGGSNAAEVWIMRSGDRNLLLASMFRAAGIPFQRVFAAQKDSNLPFVDWSEPNSRVFSLALLKVPMESGDPMYLTAGYRMAKAGRIPYSHQGGRAIVVENGRGQWTQLPVYNAEDEAMASDITLNLGSKSDPVGVDCRLELRALEQSSFKEWIQQANPTQRTVQAERFSAWLFPGSRLTSSSYPGIEDRNKPSRVDFAAETRNLIQDTGDTALLKALVAPADMRRRFVGKKDRKLPYWGAGGGLSIDQITVNLGDYKVEQLPEDLDLSGPWGTYHLSYQLDGKQIHVKRRMQMGVFLLEPEEYHTLVEICTQIDHKEQERIKLR